jgi:phenylalanyl-tRNA synthetase alpha chain
MSATNDMRLLSPTGLAQALALPDLTDPAHGHHALQDIVAAIDDRLRADWACRTVVERASPIVSVADNYDSLHYSADAVTRDARYSRYVAPGWLLRTHTTAMIPPLLRALARSGRDGDDVLLLCPGLVYRRDSIDRLHTGEPHQLDLWRIRSDAPLTTEHLREMIEGVVDAVLPGHRYRVIPSVHPYTTGGLQVDVGVGEAWVEIGECGLALPALLAESGLGVPKWSGLAMGLGLDRLLMLSKGVDDIRLLRSADPRVREQMADLRPYRALSSQPAIRRDLSIAVGLSTTAEDLGGRVREAMGNAALSLESLEILTETPRDRLPGAAIERIGIRPEQKNVLLRLVIRHPTRTLTTNEANQLRDAVYAAVHEGDSWQWATR